MTIRSLRHAAAVLILALPLFAQQQQQSGPRPKTQAESDALQKVLQAQQAGNWDAEIQAINNVLENFADTQYKPLLLSMAVDAAQNKGDYAQTIAFGEQAIQLDPNNITARVTLAEDIAQHTRDNDLDKDQSLKKVDDYANKALDAASGNESGDLAGHSKTADIAVLRRISSGG